MRLSHGFSIGFNSITYTKIKKWRSSGDYDFQKLVHYLIDIGFTIIDIGDSYFRILLLSDKQVNFFYYKVMSYK